MQKQAPSVGRILTMVLFALSCFGLLLFLWLAFGGATPLKPQGYRFHITFPEAGQLAEQADVRISGVSVGKVTDVSSAHDGTTDATVQLNAPYAPLAKDSKAILRQKTLLGETYVELTPGRPRAPKIPENGRLAAANVSPTVQLDELLSTFDPKTRAAFQTWVQQVAVAAAGRGRGLSDALGTLPPFVDNTTELLQLVDSQQGAVNKLVSNTGVVFNALSTRQGQLSSAIRNANTVFATTAARDEALRQIFLALPTFEKESTTTLYALDAFAKNTNPLVDELHPVAAQLTPTLQALDTLAPTLKTTFVDQKQVIAASKKGLPATQATLGRLPKLLGAFDQPLRQLVPVLDGVSFYKPELTAFFANTAAATQVVGREDLPGGKTNFVHYLRTLNPLSPEALTTFSHRLGTNRNSAYTLPGAFSLLATGLKSYTTGGCSNPVPSYGDPVTPPPVGQNASTSQLTLAFPWLTDASGHSNVAPPCVQQPKFPQIPLSGGGAQTTYPHLNPSPSPVARR
jgi:virulence factor Mce-like protein